MLSKLRALSVDGQMPRRVMYPLFLLDAALCVLVIRRVACLSREEA